MKSHLSATGFLIVGLGNPGPGYVGTRHNFGFILLDCLLKKISSANSFEFVKALQAEVAVGELAGWPVQLIKPQTFMNRSGFAVRALLEALNVTDLQKLIVIHDDLDLELGRTKLKLGGGSGGHNGLKSLIQEIGSADFLRLRLGIGGELKSASESVVDFVLAPFTESELDLVDAVNDRGIAGMVELLDSGVTAAMNLLNRRTTVEI